MDEYQHGAMVRGGPRTYLLKVVRAGAGERKPVFASLLYENRAQSPTEL